MGASLYVPARTARPGSGRGHRLRHGRQDAIHPTQIAPIEQHYKVKPHDLAAAQAILDESSPAVFRMHDSMCEVATHRAWAKRTVEQSRLFGANHEAGFIAPQRHAAAPPVSSTEKE
jgi:hypothetical protein